MATEHKPSFLKHHTTYSTRRILLLTVKVSIQAVCSVQLVWLFSCTCKLNSYFCKPFHVISKTTTMSWGLNPWLKTKTHTSSFLTSSLFSYYYYHLPSFLFRVSLHLNLYLSPVFPTWNSLLQTLVILKSPCKSSAGETNKADIRHRTRWI